jgi:hypothetical protein
MTPALRIKSTTVRRFDESCHAGLDPASISLEGALRAPPWIAGQARNDSQMHISLAVIPDLIRDP